MILLLRIASCLTEDRSQVQSFIADSHSLRFSLQQICYFISSGNAQFPKTFAKTFRL